MTITIESITDHLAIGRARKALHKCEESIHAEIEMVGRKPSVEKTWWISVDLLTKDGREDGCLGGWRINWHRFKNDRGLTMNLELFADGLAALAATGFMDALIALGDEPTPQQVLDLLSTLDFVDVTPRLAMSGVAL